MTDTSPFGALDGLGPDARRALDAAAAEVESLGHDRIGTEHLLLGVLADEGTPAAVALRQAGVSLAAARHKVHEAVGTAAPRPPGASAPPATKRASRAVEWAVRISHQRRADAVASSDLLLGILNVEGTAGQVLRGLGIDVDRLSAAIVHGATGGGAVQVVSSGPAPALRCPSCGEEIGARLRADVVAAQADDGTGRDVRVFSCGSCGAVLGVGQA